MSYIFNFFYDYEILEIILFTTFNDKIYNSLKLLTIFKFIFFQINFKEHKFINLGFVIFIFFFDLYLFFIFLGMLIFEQFEIFKKRTSMEKLLWSYLLIEPFFDEKFILWKYFSIFMLFYFFFIITFKNKKSFIFSNLVFFFFIIFLIYKNFSYILYLLKNEFIQIAMICLTILFFFYIISNIEKKIKLKNTIKRKLFHFLALLIFTYPIIYEVK